MQLVQSSPSDLPNQGLVPQRDTHEAGTHFCLIWEDNALKGQHSKNKQTQNVKAQMCDSRQMESFTQDIISYGV